MQERNDGRAESGMEEWIEGMTKKTGRRMKRRRDKEWIDWELYA